MEHEQRETLNADPDSRTDGAQAPGDQPTGQAERGAYRNVTCVQADVHPEQPLEADCTREISQPRVVHSTAATAANTTPQSPIWAAKCTSKGERARRITRVVATPVPPRMDSAAQASNRSRCCCSA
jgi:hypothetical protein